MRFKAAVIVVKFLLKLPPMKKHNYCLIVMISMVVPCISFYILKYRCIATWVISTASGWSNTAIPIACLTLGTMEFQYHGINLMRKFVNKDSMNCVHW
jgi:hypothetical protein